MIAPATTTSASGQTLRPISGSSLESDMKVSVPKDSPPKHQRMRAIRSTRAGAGLAGSRSAATPATALATSISA